MLLCCVILSFSMLDYFPKDKPTDQRKVNLPLQKQSEREVEEWREKFKAQQEAIVEKLKEEFKTLQVSWRKIKCLSFAND